MIDTFFIHDIKIRRPGTTTGRGSDVVKDWSAATDTPAKGWVAQRSTDDLRDVRTGDVSDFVLQCAATVDVRPGDRVVWGSLVFDVEGRPLEAYTPRGEHHTEVALRLVEG